MKIKHWAEHRKKNAAKKRKKERSPSSQSTSSIHSNSSSSFTSKTSGEPSYTLKPSVPSQAFQKSTLPLLSLPKVPQRPKNNTAVRGHDKQWLHDSVTAIVSPPAIRPEIRYTNPADSGVSYSDKGCTELPLTTKLDIKSTKSLPVEVTHLSNHDKQSMSNKYSQQKENKFHSNINYTPNIEKSPNEPNTDPIKNNMESTNTTMDLDEELMEIQKINQDLINISYGDHIFPTVTLPYDQAQRTKFPVGSVAIIERPNSKIIQVMIESVSLEKTTFKPRYNVWEKKMDGTYAYHKYIREETLKEIHELRLGNVVDTNADFTLSDADNNVKQRNSTNCNSDGVSQQESVSNQLSKDLKHEQRPAHTQKTQLRDMMSKVSTDNDMELNIKNTSSNNVQQHSQVQTNGNGSISSSQYSKSIPTVAPPPYRKSSIIVPPKIRHLIFLKNGLPLKNVARTVAGPHGKTHQKLQNETKTRIKFHGDGFGLRQKISNNNVGNQRFLDNPKMPRKQSMEMRPHIEVLGDNENNVNRALKKVADLIVSSVGSQYRDQVWKDLLVINLCLRKFTNAYKQEMKSKKTGKPSATTNISSNRENTVPSLVTVEDDQGIGMLSSPTHSSPIVEGTFSPCVELL